MKLSRLVLLVLMFMLMACSPSNPAADSEPTAVVTLSASPTTAPTAVPPTLTAVPTLATVAVVETSTLEPTTTTMPAETPTATLVVAEPVFFGRTAEGALFRGAADAPVTLIDYSDFL